MESHIMIKPTDGHISYIVNPKSGASSIKRLGKLFEDYLVSKKYKVKVSFTYSLEHACELAQIAAKDEDCVLVVAVGGDGTVREIAHGLEGSGKKLLIIPGGTENLLANELGFDDTLETTIKTFEAGMVKTLDLGNINGKCFTSIAGIGFDGEIVKIVAKKRSGNITHLDYFWPIWRTFWNYKFQPVKVEVDGKEIFNGKCMIFVGNISRYAVGLGILKDADYNDGLLDICIYKCSTKIQLIKHSAMTAIKKHVCCKDVMYLKCKNIKITSDYTDIATEIDGDPGPSLPAEIKIIPNAVKCLVPPESKPAGLRTRMARAIK
jgi:diacylglycerol kinase (ATP)